MKKHSFRRATKRGFTLIELLVVVVIIGILAAIATPIYLNQKKAAWKATAISDASSGALAVETARVQNGGTLDGVRFTTGVDGKPMLITVGGTTAAAPTPKTTTTETGTKITATNFTMAVGDPKPTLADFRASATGRDGEPVALTLDLTQADLSKPGTYAITITSIAGDTATAQLTVVAAGSTGDTTKSPVSPGNTETAWVGKDSSGAECYAVMTTNKNLDGWAAVRTSAGLATGTPPANGSADCPRPASPAPSSPDDADTVASKIYLAAYIDGSYTTVPVDLELVVSGSTATVSVVNPGSVVNGAAAVSVDTVAGSKLAVVSVAEVPVSDADPAHPVSIDWYSPNPLIVGLANGSTVSIDVANQTATVHPAA